MEGFFYVFSEYVHTSMVMHPYSHDPTKYHKFRKVDGAKYDQVNQFLRKRTFITAREWAISRLCADFQTSSGAEMTYIGKNLPELVPPPKD
jgi:hypothetical protein